MNNLDKTIKELTNRLDVVHPYSASASNNHQYRNDGITYWKGKKIISVKDWNILYKKNSTYTDSYKTTLTSRKPLQYFPDDYNGSISTLRVIDELKEEALKWNINYYELLEYRKNPILGRVRCSKCLLSGSLDDPIFNGIEKVFARIVSNQCNNNDNSNTKSTEYITYHCNVMNIFSCPFESKEESKFPYKREDLFALQRISFAIEQAITTFFETTRNNEIIYEVDFVNDRVKEIHTKYNGEAESWGWTHNVKEQLSKVKPISNIVIRDKQDFYNILTNREKLECLLQEYENKINHQLSKKEDEELEIEYLKPELKEKMKEELRKHKEEQLILVKDNKQNIVNFIIDNKDSINVEDLKIYEPIYKCYRKKGNCFYCNTITNIICKNCSNYNQNNNNKETWICKSHWQQHAIMHH
jgi:hypothetical protein